MRARPGLAKTCVARSRPDSLARGRSNREDTEEQPPSPASPACLWTRQASRALSLALARSLHPRSFAAAAAAARARALTADAYARAQMPIITENGIDPFAPIEGVASNEWAHLILGPPGMQPPGPGLDLMDVPLTTAGDGRAEMKPARGHRRAAEPRRAAVKLEDMDRDDPFKGQFDDDDDELGDDGTGRGNLNRGKYRCGRCGQYKVNHQCPFIIDRSCRTVGAQARPRARFSSLSLSRCLLRSLTQRDFWCAAAGFRRTRGSPSCRLDRRHSQFREMHDEASLGSFYLGARQDTKRAVYDTPFREIRGTAMGRSV